MSEEKLDWQIEEELCVQKEQSLEKRYADKGITIKASCYSSDRPAHVDSVKLKYTPEQWLDMFNVEGDILPYCCSTISNIRDVLIGTLRNDGYISTSELEDVADALKAHHDCDDNEDNELRYLLNLWETVKDDTNVSACKLPTRDPNDLFDALNVLEEYLPKIAFDRIVSDKDGANAAAVMRCLHSIMPCIATIHSAIKENKVEPVIGWAIMRNDEIVTYRHHGYAIFKDKGYANYLAYVVMDHPEELNKNLYLRHVKFDLTGIHYLSDPVEVSEADYNSYSNRS